MLVLHVGSIAGRSRLGAVGWRAGRIVQDPPLQVQDGRRRSDPTCVAAVRKLELRRPDTCNCCGIDLPAGTSAWWDPTQRSVACVACPAPTVPPRLEQWDAGTPGVSLHREYERRRQRREARVRDDHPHIGGLLLAVRDAPQHEMAFLRGARGEEAVAESLERRTADSPAILLHSRRMPGGRGDIDHLAVVPTGIFVIDAKDHRGKVRVSAPVFGEAKLTVAGRDRTRLIDGLDRQVAAVRSALDACGHAEVPVHGALCFTTAELPILGTLTMRGHLIVYRKALAKRLNASGLLAPPAIRTLARELARALPPT